MGEIELPVPGRPLSRLCSFPALFAYETGIDKPARIGSITNIDQGSSHIAFAFKIDPKERCLGADELLEMQGALGITNPFELSRTHWAIKNVAEVGA